jgi:hypothetical protein
VVAALAAKEKTWERSGFCYSCEISINSFLIPLFQTAPFRKNQLRVLLLWFSRVPDRA